MISIPTPEQIESVRAFNRFYTRQIGLLNAGLLESPFSLTEARILYELAHGGEWSAAGLGKSLGLDAGYLSRTLGRLERRGLVRRVPSERDRRQFRLELTAAGEAEFAGLDRQSKEHVGRLLQPLGADECARLVSAMQVVGRLLGDETPARVPYLLRPHRVGDIGWITRRQGMLYAQEYGWDESFEALVAEIMARFVREYDPRFERSWIAERDGEIVGSVFVVRQSDEVAKLRLLYVEPSARGLGIGAKLVEECIAFSRSKGYRTLTLWTNDILVSARRIYQAAGFRLVDEDRHHSFGKDLVGQNWELALN